MDALKELKMIAMQSEYPEIAPSLILYVLRKVITPEESSMSLQSSREERSR